MKFMYISWLKFLRPPAKVDSVKPVAGGPWQWAQRWELAETNDCGQPNKEQSGWAIHTQTWMKTIEYAKDRKGKCYQYIPILYTFEFQWVSNSFEGFHAFVLVEIFSLEQ